MYTFLFFFFYKREKKAILLVLPFKEICIWPELSSPVYFRIQGRWSDCYGQRMNGEQTNGNPCV